jgi:hypothetical protein
MADTSQPTVPDVYDEAGVVSPEAWAALKPASRSTYRVVPQASAILATWRRDDDAVTFDWTEIQRAAQNKDNPNHGMARILLEARRAGHLFGG